MLDETVNGEQDPLALALGTGAEGVICQPFAPERL